MKNFVSFFEIPAADFGRAVKFYEEVFGIQMPVCNCENEKMAFFSNENGQPVGAVSWANDFNPSREGVLVSLVCRDMEKTVSLIKENGGEVLTGKTKIEAQGMGYFSIFLDTEGNRLGLYSDR